MFWLSSSLQDDMQSGDDAENGDDMSPTMGGPEPMYAVEVLSGCSTETQDACETQCDVHLHDQPTGMSVEKPTAKCAAKKKAKRKVSGDDVKPKTPRAKAKGPNKTAAKAKVSPCAKASAKAKTTQAPLVQGAPEGIPQSVWDEEDPDLFEMLPEIEPIMPVNQVEQLENRISTMESALNRIINYIEQNTTTLIAEQ